MKKLSYEGASGGWMGAVLSAFNQAVLLGIPRAD